MHADDLGRTRGVTDSILDCVDNGALRSVSVLANGDAFDFAMAECAKRPHLRVSVHLNLCEGRPVSASDAVAPLVDGRGVFRHSFHSLWLAHAFASREERDALRRAVEVELGGQIAKVRSRLKAGHAVAVDGHRHMHMIPFVFDTLLDLHREDRIDYIRIPQEAFVFGPQSMRQARCYFGANIVKFLLLNRLSSGRKEQLATLGIRCADAFMGVLFTGCMSADIVLAACKDPGMKQTVEILFHPGRAVAEEESLWAAQPALAGFYLSPQRQYEAEALKDPRLERFVETGA